MPTPLMPAVDAAGRLREVAFALLVRDHEPVPLSALAEGSRLSIETVARSVAALAEAGWIDLDDHGRVAGAAGLSLLNGPHQLTIGDASFRTWCAYDALGIPAALRADGDLATTCGVCGREMRVGFRAGLPDRPRPERLWLAAGGADLRGSFCSPTVLLCGDEHGRSWATAQGGQGELLDLDAASRRGSTDWAGCADALRALS